MDLTDRFAELLARPEPEIPLDEAALLIAAHAHPDLDLDARLAQLDALAASAAGLSADELATRLFVTEGFTGNESDYGDPRNSFLDDVLDRHLGIPITLSVVMLEVGRRVRAAAARRRACPATSSSAAVPASGSTPSTTAPGSTSPAVRDAVRAARTPARGSGPSS